MPTCTHCASTWTWRETIKASMTTNDYMTCPHCQARHYQTTKSKKLSTMITLILLTIPFIASTLFDGSARIGLLLLLINTVIFLACYPFILKTK